MIEWIGYEAVIVEDLKNISKNDRIILPGIGNFGRAMKYLRQIYIIILVSTIE